MLGREEQDERRSVWLQEVELRQVLQDPGDAKKVVLIALEIPNWRVSPVALQSNVERAGRTAGLPVR